MKDIPMFTTDDGVASLILKEIPYRGTAYVKIQDMQPGRIQELMEECAGFCRAAGAERVYASGHPELEWYPLYSTIYQMSLSLPELPQPEANLWPVTQETVGRWRKICNQAMANVDNAATQTAQDEKEIIDSGGAYFVHDAGKLLGIGWMIGSELAVLVSAQPGAGERVARTLFTAADSNRITLEVVSTNGRAIRLYERMGFLKTGERSRWYQIL